MQASARQELSRMLTLTSKRALCGACVTLCMVEMVKASDNSACDNNDDDEEVDTWIADGGFFLLFIGVGAMFWGLAAVCEEYFVPALNIMCEELNVPDDVAGATFMAAGASSPEMFTSFIALFIDHSTLGVGTVVGSEIFNHMIICAGSVMYSEEGVLYLDKFVFSRDVAAYFLSLLMLLWALKGNPLEALSDMFASGVENECLNVTVVHATGLLLLYVCYAVVAGNFQDLLKKFNLHHVNGPQDEDGDDQQREEQGGDGLRQSLLDMTPIPEDVEQDGEADGILSVLTSAVQGGDSAAPGQSRKGQPSAPPSTSYSYRSRRLTGGQSLRVKGVSQQSMSASMSMSQQRSSFVKDQALFSWRSSSVRQSQQLWEGGEEGDEEEAVMRSSKAVVIGPGGCLRRGASADELGTMEISPRSLSGYLSLRSSFYNMRCCSLLKSWRLRYFTLDQHGFHSRKERSSNRRGPQVELIDLQSCSEVKVLDRAKGLFVLLRAERDEKPYEFAATSLELLDEVVARLTTMLQEARSRTSEQRLQFNRKASTALDGELHLGSEGEVHLGLLDPPDVLFGSPRGMLLTASHYVLYPLKWLLHHSLPDVMLKGGRQKYVSCLFISVLWLALLSYVMIKCCDGLGQWIGTSPIVMGLTLSAIGTSFPNLWSSMLVARQGLGNMAVSNAFGSNTFNICIALGLPWFCLVVISGDPYEKMRDDGIVFMVVLLMAILVLFYLAILLNSWRIKYWMSYYFVAVYIGVMIYAILHG